MIQKFFKVALYKENFKLGKPTRLDDLYLEFLNKYTKVFISIQTLFKPEIHHQNLNVRR